MQWKFFLGACLLTTAVLQPHAPGKSLVGGIGLAALARWAWALGIDYRQRRRRGNVDSGSNGDSGRPGPGAEGR